MSIFGSIMSKIFHSASAAPAAPSATDASVPAPASADPAAAPTTAAPAGAAVDVEAVCSDLAAKNPEKLDWQHSIVDLMKLLDLDSSHTSRIELAHELNYTGDTNDSASMNIWLHKQVMTKLAENGGKVPESLKV